MPTLVTPERLAENGTEDGHQSAFFCWAVTASQSEPLLRLLYAIPNGGKRDIVTATRLKATGTKRGFPDIGFPVARHGCHGLFIEMKRPNDKPNNKRQGALRTEQERWQDALRLQGYAAVEAIGWQHARNIVEAYLEEQSEC